MKPWYLSKTLWVNLIAAVAFFLQAQFGYVIEPETQMYAIVLVNGVLRWITQDRLTLS